MFKKIKDYAYVRYMQSTAPGHYEVKICRGCETPIKSNFWGLCKGCQKHDREYRKSIPTDVSHTARIIREHKAGRI